MPLQECALCKIYVLVHFRRLDKIYPTRWADTPWHNHPQPPENDQSTAVVESPDESMDVQYSQPPQSRFVGSPRPSATPSLNKSKDNEKSMSAPSENKNMEKGPSTSNAEVNGEEACVEGDKTLKVKLKRMKNGKETEEKSPRKRQKKRSSCNV